MLWQVEYEDECVYYFFCCFLFDVFFFFQAEDGIRYLVRSRGLGDVYKRQQPAFVDFCVDKPLMASEIPAGLVLGSEQVSFEKLSCQAPKVISFPFSSALVSVSYTHLTLPTSDLV